jgi:hypothetical protein
MGRPAILKSPTHGARVSTLRELLPDARYVLIVRNPLNSFESVVRMWRKMFETYAIGPVPPDRPRFEAKLATGAVGLPANRFMTITCESLVADPGAVIERLYKRLDLGDFAAVREAVLADTKRRSSYQAKGSLPSDLWRQRIADEWAAILAHHAMLR